MSVRVPLTILVCVSAALCQQPVINPGGIVNAASYYEVAPGVFAYPAPGSIASIFGSNLATVTESAGSLPLPLSLGGTSVTFYGIPAPIFYVSPTQVNIQVPASTAQPIDDNQFLVVTTSAGASGPTPTGFLQYTDPFGIFTLDASGCGPGAIFNVASDGSVSLNSPSNSASPGQFITIWGTGLGEAYNEPPDGSPAPSSPLASAEYTPAAFFDVEGPAFNISSPIFARPSFAGRAPGFVGLDQVNVQIPTGVREGCAVPLIVAGPYGGSQDVPISIHTGGGACVDPPSAGYGQIVWDRDVQMATGAETDTLTASFWSSPGMQAPPAPQYEESQTDNVEIDYAKFCTVPGYRGLDAGGVTAAPPAGAPVEAAVSSSSGQTVYQATLPAGSIQPGSFSVSASGGADVGAFQASTQIGSGIQVTSSFPPGTVIPTLLLSTPFAVQWTGGDPNEWVTVTITGHGSGIDQSDVRVAHASDGVALFYGEGPMLALGIASTQPGQAEITIEVDPDPSQVQTISVPGLSLGAEVTWKYTYHFTGLTLQ
jgi:uncharacterized protein (TIGR03437 family)